jgi:hypothetical protein
LLNCVTRRRASASERPVLDRRHHLLHLRIFGTDNQRHPQPVLAKPFDEIADRQVDAARAQQDDAVGGRALEQLGKVRIDFGVMAQGESRASLFGPRAAVAVDDVQGEALFHGHHLAPDALDMHVEAPRK